MMWVSVPAVALAASGVCAIVYWSATERGRIGAQTGPHEVTNSLAARSSVRCPSTSTRTNYGAGKSTKALAAEELRQTSVSPARVYTGYFFQRFSCFRHISGTDPALTADAVPRFPRLTPGSMSSHCLPGFGRCDLRAEHRDTNSIRCLGPEQVRVGFVGRWAVVRRGILRDRRKEALRPNWAALAAAEMASGLLRSGFKTVQSVHGVAV